MDYFFSGIFKPLHLVTKFQSNSFLILVKKRNFFKDLKDLAYVLKKITYIYISFPDDIIKEIDHSFWKYYGRLFQENSAD